MSETTWSSLPTHNGWWWRRTESINEQWPIRVTMLDDGPYCTVEDVSKVRDGVFYAPVSPPPPADAGKLPRRFLWKATYGIQWTNGTVEFDDREGICADGADDWLLWNADEIKWIDP